ncbi:MAG TPA: GNAT family N-acetyltransferase [Micromonosporaceae bacterium]|nr:GNAT family N-acetyltransferase [Micromonosporaceae bacterium]
MIDDPGAGPGSAVPDVRVVPGLAEQVDALAAVIAEAFHELAVNRWMVPDDARRRIVDPGRFALVIEEALTHGAVSTTDGLSAVAVWLSCPRPAGAATDARTATRLREICGDDAERCLSFEAAMAAHHPAPAHWHLALLGVLPDRQRQGLGSVLLRHRHARLDRQGRAAYLEAASPRGVAFYRRFGYREAGPAFPVGPGAPCVHPMWRDPADPGSRPA